MKKPFLLASVALFAVAAASPALAQGKGAGPRGERMLGVIFAKVDTNKDGKITKEEIVAYRTAQFKAADKNNDGFLEGEEIRVFITNRRFAMRDADGDGKISAKEFGERRADRFKELDQNKDGTLTPEELQAARDTRMRRMRKAGERAKQGQRRGMRRHHRRGRGMAIMRLDLNRDGRISVAEYNLQGDRMFLSFDLNSDGSITKIEMRQRMAMGFGRGWKKGRHHRMRGHGGMRHHGMRGHGGRGDRMNRGPGRPAPRGGQPN